MQGEINVATSTQTEVPQAPAHHHHHITTALFHREPHRHQPRNVNLIHEAEKKAAGFNDKLALLLTKSVGTMICAYIFAMLAIIGFPGLLGTQVSTWVQWTSQTFIQLTMLSVIMVGQAVLGRKQELQSEEQFNTTMSTYHDIEQIMDHLAAQDGELLRHTKILIHLLEKNGISIQEVEAEMGKTRHLDTYIDKPSGETLPPPPAPPTEGAK